TPARCRTVRTSSPGSRPRAARTPPGPAGRCRPARSPARRSPPEARTDAAPTAARRWRGRSRSRSWHALLRTAPRPRTAPDAPPRVRSMLLDRATALGRTEAASAELAQRRTRQRGHDLQVLRDLVAGQAFADVRPHRVHVRRPRRVRGHDEGHHPLAPPGVL